MAPGVKPVFIKEGSFPLGDGDDPKLFEQVSLAKEMLEREDEIELVLLKLHRTVMRILENEKLSPTCLDYMLKKVLKMFFDRLISRSQTTHLDHVLNFFQSLVRLLAKYIQFLWPSHLEMLQGILSWESTFYCSGTEKEKFKATFTEGAPLFIKSLDSFITSRYYHQLVNYFGELGGFSKLLSGLAVKDFESSLEKLITVTKHFVKLRPIFVSEWQKEYGTIIWHHLTNIMLHQKGDSAIMKNLHMAKAREIVDWLEQILQDAFGDQLEEQQRHFYLDFAFTFFQTPYLEKRLHGVNHITSVFDAELNQPKVKSHTLDLPWRAYLDEWIRKNEIIRKLYVDNVHIQILLRCHKIPEYMAMRGTLTSNDICIIWDAGVGKHESILHAIYSSCAIIAERLEHNLLEYMFSLLVEVPTNQRGVEYFDLLQKISANAVTSSPEPITPTKTYGLYVAWNMLSECEMMSEETKTLALNLVKQGLQWQNCISQREFFMKDCISCIKEHKRPLTMLQTLKIIIDMFHKTNGGGGAVEVNEVIFKLDEEDSLLVVLLNDLVYYKENTETSLPYEEEMDVLHSSRDYVSSPSALHLYEIKQRLYFISFILSISSVCLSIDQIELLWSTIIENAFTLSEKRAGLFWLQELGDVSSVHPPFSIIEYKYIFNEKCSTLDIKSVDISHVDVIVAYFYYLNFLEDRIGYFDDGKPLINCFDLFGFDLLWRIVFESTDAVSGLRVIQFLTNLLGMCSKELQGNIPDYGESYIKTCLSEIEKSMEDADQHRHRILRALLVLQMLSKSFSKPVYEKGIPIEFQVRDLGKQGISFALSLFTHHPISTLRAQVAQALHTEPHRVRLIYRGSEWNDNDGVLEEKKIQQGRDNQNLFYAIRPPGLPLPLPCKPFRPSLLLSKNEYFHGLFSLLSKASIQNQAWELVITLPTNKEKLEALSNINPSMDWNQALDSSSIHKLLYNLKIIKSLLSKHPMAPETKEWYSWFKNTKGVKTLFSLFIGTDLWKEQHISNIHISCLALLAELLVHFSVHTEEEKIYFAIEYLQEANLSSEMFIGSLFDMMSSVNAHVESELSISPLLELYSSHASVNVEKGEEVVLFLANCFELFKACCCTIPTWGNSFVEHPSISIWIQRLLLSRDAATRETTMNGLVPLFAALSTQELKFSAFSILVRLLPKISDVCSHAEHFYRLLELLVKRFCAHSPELRAARPFSGLFRILCGLLQEREIVEINRQIQDPVLTGILNLLTTLYKANVCVDHEIAMDLTKEVFEKCLFLVPSSNEEAARPLPKCKHSVSREAAYQLLLELATCSMDVWNKVVDHIEQHHDRPFTPTSCAYNPSSLVKANCGYVGLQNLGATCYMNALIQQLYMVETFRVGILSVPDPMDDDLDNSFLFQFKKLFAFLQESAKKFYATEPFCRTISDFNPREQKDANEYFNHLFDKLEELTKDTEQKTLLNDVFGGSVCNQIISKECQHNSEKKENFFALAVAVKGKSSLEESLAFYIEGDMLEGDNKYQCSKCSKKVPALKRCCIDTLPNTLVIHLQRFEYDFHQDRRIKVNDLFKFPFELNMEPYTKEGLSCRESDSPLPLKPDHYYKYELCGILVHFGSAEMGHYYSFIKDSSPQGQWFQYNDQDVSTFDENSIPSQCYGGPSPLSNPESVANTLQSNNAYMLFYRRIVPVEVQSEGEKSTKKAQLEPSCIQSDIYENIWRENKDFVLDTFLFESDYFCFVYKLLYQCQCKYSQQVTSYGEPLDASCPRFKAIQLGCKVVAQSLCRAKDRKRLPYFVSLLQDLLQKHMPACTWILEMVVEYRWVELNILHCRLSSSSNFTELISFVISSLISSEDEFYCEFIDDNNGQPLTPEGLENDNDWMVRMDCNKEKSHVARFFSHYFQLIPTLASAHGDIVNYFVIIRDFMMTGQPEIHFLLQKCLCSLLINFFMEDENSRVDSSVPVLPTKHLSKVNLTIMFEIIYELTTNGVVDSEEEDETEPSNLSLQILEEDLKRLYWPDFYIKAFQTKQDTRVVFDIAHRLLLHNQNFSSNLLRRAIERLYDVPHYTVEYLCVLLQDSFRLNDSIREWRFCYIFSTLMTVMEHHYMKSLYITSLLFKKLVEWIEVYPEVNSYLVENVDDWLFSWLIFADFHLIRSECEALIYALFPSIEEEDDDFLPDFEATVPEKSSLTNSLSADQKASLKTFLQQLARPTQYGKQ